MQHESGASLKSLQTFPALYSTQSRKSVKLSQSIVFCTGRLPFEYKTYTRQNAHTHALFCKGVCVGNWQPKVCQREGREKQHHSLVYTTRFDFLPLTERSTATLVAALRQKVVNVPLSWSCIDWYKTISEERWEVERERECVYVWVCITWTVSKKSLHFEGFFF